MQFGFYKQQQSGPDKRFIETLEDAINRVCRNPLLYRKVDNEPLNAGYCISLTLSFSETIQTA